MHPVPHRWLFAFAAALSAGAASGQFPGGNVPFPGSGIYSGFGYPGVYAGAGVPPAGFGYLNYGAYGTAGVYTGPSLAPRSYGVYRGGVGPAYIPPVFNVTPFTRDLAAYGGNSGFVYPTPSLAPINLPTTTAAAEVLAPDGAKVTLSGIPADTLAGVRRFTSPPLVPGKTYTYTARATWTEAGKPVTREKAADVRAGQRVTIDLTKP